MKKRMEKGIRWRDSIQTRQIIGFAVITVFMILSSMALFGGMMRLAGETTYEKMNNNTNYFLRTMESQISHIRQLQNDFFNERQLTFLENSEMNISTYEKRSALLNVQERLQTITGVSELVEDGFVCFPESDYWITEDGIEHISYRNRATLRMYLADDVGEVNFDGRNFYVVQVSSNKNNQDQMPQCILGIRFSSDTIKKELKTLHTSKQDGAFYYFEEEEYLLADGENQQIYTNILQKLKRNENGEYLNVQEVRIDGENFLVCVGGTGSMGVFVQYIEEAQVMDPLYRFRDRMFGIMGIFVLMAVIFVGYTGRLIHRPIGLLLDAFSRLEVGDWSVKIDHRGKDEFGVLYRGFNNMRERITHLIDEVYVQKNLTQKARLKQLQAQINPHFLYNSFFILSRRIKRGDYENAQEIADHLGDYFQFLTRNESDDVPLKREVEHAKSYTAIQAVRYAGRIAIDFGELPEDAEGILVPRLIFQPLLENVFGHGLYNKEENGILRVRFLEDNREIRIRIEDNGEELDDVLLKKLQDALEKEDGKITGMVNIHRRLSYYFQGKGGLILERSELGGLCVTVRIAKEEKEDGTESADC